MASGKESVVKVTNSEEKKKALDAAIAKLEKDFGKGAVMKLGESGAHVSVETVPTGCLSLDLALGLGGVPKGRVIEVYGPESSGKTTIAYDLRSAETWRNCRLYRCRACIGSGLCKEYRSGY